ncbi:hypothetical protein ACNVED_09375 [Legionella sp. D16C41]|uniref:hypothetical protein n=1 Tax=Legionella sp. D16C41 TaxID=3402688 RepID=UPI003AF8BA48
MKRNIKGLMLLPFIGSLTACGFVTTGVSDYTTIYPSTAGCCGNTVVINKPCCKQVVVKPVVRRVHHSCCTKVVRPVVASPCCSSVVTTPIYTPAYNTMTVVNTEPVDVTSVTYDYY